jgi:hypothetical protein
MEGGAWPVTNDHHHQYPPVKIIVYIFHIGYLYRSHKKVEPDQGQSIGKISLPITAPVMKGLQGGRLGKNGYVFVASKY